MAKTNYQTIDEYHSTFTGDVLKRMQRIRELVHKVAPEAKEVISYQIPAFKIDDKYYLIYYCAFKNHLTLSSPWSEAILKKFEADLKGMKVSKSAIQFPHNMELPLDLIERILRFRKTEI
ncbi:MULTISPECIES: iron chaperone [Galbibacter]|uniref:DUF1801 domain-containing protein n=1 Tax=Galbibacter pacificus TaxID=2996052 RepID=A0ABT6FMZ5_9FLAO|nr:DUF1801 domain-containing protein [Galbibacter pacificus]MDG3581162.1 DUF1801 domain-containing protein [Galbibacter pacificus]MDG3584640.1 DUF1801 domain-containing protein [Galbibacter pacificus]